MKKELFTRQHRMVIYKAWALSSLVWLSVGLIISGLITAFMPSQSWAINWIPMWLTIVVMLLQPYFFFVLMVKLIEALDTSGKHMPLMGPEIWGLPMWFFHKYLTRKQG